MRERKLNVSHILNVSFNSYICGFGSENGCGWWRKRGRENGPQVQVGEPMRRESVPDHVEAFVDVFALPLHAAYLMRVGLRRGVVGVDQHLHLGPHAQFLKNSALNSPNNPTLIVFPFIPIISPTKVFGISNS